MPYTLNIGPGRSGVGDVKIDLVQYQENPIDHILDLAVEDIPYPDNTFEHVRAEHMLEHIPACVHWLDLDGVFQHRFSRVALMSEIYRVLKPAGTLHASVPIAPGQGWNGDPTHEDVPWSIDMFSRFYGEWGGNKLGHESTESSGINFAFELQQKFEEPLGQALTVVLRKPA